LRELLSAKSAQSLARRRRGWDNGFTKEVITWLTAGISFILAMAFLVFAWFLIPSD